MRHWLLLFTFGVVGAFVREGFAAPTPLFLSPLDAENAESNRRSEGAVLRRLPLLIDDSDLSEARKRLVPFSIQLPLATGTDVRGTVLAKTVLAEGSLLLTGHFETEGEFTLIIGSSHLIGNITVNGEHHQIRIRNGKHVVEQLDPAMVPQERHPKVTADEIAPGADSARGLRAATTGSNTVVDVLVLYTSEARDGEGGAAAIRDLARLSVIETNSIYSNSVISHRVRLVHIAEIDYEESNFDWDDAIEHLRDPNDGKMDEAQVLRNTYGADAVLLLVNDTASGGLAYVMGSPAVSFASKAFGIVSTFVSAASGWWTFTHELGHIMGSAHDRANAGGYPYFDTHSYEYSFGYQEPSGDFRDVMAYPDGCGGGCPRIKYLSNPRVQYNGKPIGVSVGSTDPADNAQSHNNTAATVANFRGTVCYPTVLPNVASFGRLGGNGQVQLSIASGCEWALSVNQNWLQIDASQLAGSSSATVNYTVPQNTSCTARSAEITILGSGAHLTVSQSGTVAANPTDVSVGSLTTTSAIVTWGTSTQPAGTTFDVRRTGATNAVFTSVNSGFLDGGLTPGASYCYEVRALNNSCSPSESAWSSPVCVTLPTNPCGGLATPNGLAVSSISTNSVTLTWSTAGQPAGTTYDIERESPNALFTNVAPGYIDPGRQSSTTYRYRVRAAKPACVTTGWSNFVAATTAGGTLGDSCGNPFSIPSNQYPQIIQHDTNGFASDFARTPNFVCSLSYPACGPDVVYSFTPATSGRYAVQFDGSRFENGQMIVYVMPNCTSDSCAEEDSLERSRGIDDFAFDAVSGTNYRIVVDGGGSSAPCGAGPYTLRLGPCSTIHVPAGLQASSVDATSVRLTWDATGQPPATSFGFERVNPDGTLTNFVSYDDGAHLDTGLTPGATYQYRVLGNHSHCTDTAYSPFVSVTLPLDPCAGLHTPTGLAVVSTAENSIAVSWNSSGQAAGTTFDLYRSGSAGPVTLTNVTTPWTDTGLAAGTIYTYQIRAVRAGCAGSPTDYSPGVAATTACTALTIRTPPEPQTVCAGATVAFSVDADGSPNISYQWNKGATVITGATSPTLELPGVTTADVGAYTCTLTNACSSLTSPVAALAVNEVPAVSITAPDSICRGSAGNSASVPPAGVGAAYSWSISGGTITAGQGTRTITFTAGPTEAVLLNASVRVPSGCSASETREITVNSCARILIDEDFDNGVPSSFTVLQGSVSGSGGSLVMTSGCIGLPGTFNRARGLTIEADVRVNDPSFGDFNLFSFYDTISDCNNGPANNGYYHGTYPAGSDNPNDLLHTIRSGVNTNLVSVPASINAGQWVRLKIQYGRNGSISAHINSVLKFSTSNMDHHSGKIALRSWATVLVDNLRVSTDALNSGDFNSDGKSDILWRNYSSGEVNIWFLSNTVYLSGANLFTVADPNWHLEASGDFNGSGSPDLLWRNYVTGAVNIWFLDGSTYIGGANLFNISDPNWKIEGVADFNEDGKVDILWRNYGTGEVNVWYLDGTDYIGGASLFTVADSNWHLEGTGDFDGDGDPDLIWRNYDTGDVNIWFLESGAYVGGANLFNVPDPNWKIEAIEDYSGDGKPDLVWRNYATGDVNIWFMDGVNYTGGANLFNISILSWVIEGPR